MNIDDAVDLWEKTRSNDVELREFLGMDRDDYNEWIETGHLPADWKFPDSEVG